jgi:5-methylcytosine-specific restriction endonuclease McrA
VFEYVPPISDVDVLTSPDAVAAELGSGVPRGEDTPALLMLDPEALSDAGRVDLLVACERHIALLQAAQQRVLASLDGRALDWSGTKLVDYTREQVGAALRLSPGTAERRLSVARTLVDRLPATLDLLRTGQLTYLHAMKLAEAITPFDAETTAKIEHRALARAPQQSLSQFGTSLRRAVIAADPRQAEQRYDDAIEARRVVFTPQDDGITELWALLPAEGAALIEAVLSSLANGQTDARTADQRRADALVDVFARVLGDPSLPETHGQRPAINVTVPIATLLGCDEQPANLDGYGPITPAMARRLAADETGTWRRLVTDDTGQLLDYGRRTYRPPANLRDHVIARDRTCTFPSCRRAARLCDLDHGEPFSRGGDTSGTNVSALCRRHHNAKHDAGWRVRHRRDGSREWTGPTGHAYLMRLDDG